MIQWSIPHPAVVKQNFAATLVFTIFFIITNVVWSRRRLFYFFRQKRLKSNFCSFTLLLYIAPFIVASIIIFVVVLGRFSLKSSPPFLTWSFPTLAATWYPGQLLFDFLTIFEGGGGVDQRKLISKFYPRYYRTF